MSRHDEGGRQEENAPQERGEENIGETVEKGLDLRRWERHGKVGS
tara:strand:+ start:493 stop:627 length:135 start_codon:yes stop_codon:yes gene_type:complete